MRHETKSPRPKTREPSKMRLVGGRRPVLEILRHQGDSILRVVIASGAKFPQELERRLEELKLRGVAIDVLSSADLDNLAEGLRHQGVVAELSHRVSVSLEVLVKKAKREVSGGLLVALDQVSDPQNLGALLRAAECSGANGVIIPKKRSAPISAVATKASAGASELVPICPVANLRQALLKCKDAGYWIVGAAIGEGSKQIFETELPQPLVLVLGAEGQGLRKLTIETCDILVEIPMQGCIESLNVSQSAAVLLFELVRRRSNVKENSQ